MHSYVHDTVCLLMLKKNGLNTDSATSLNHKCVSNLLQMLKNYISLLCKLWIVIITNLHMFHMRSCSLIVNRTGGFFVFRGYYSMAEYHKHVQLFYKKTLHKEKLTITTCPVSADDMVQRVCQVSNF